MKGKRERDVYTVTLELFRVKKLKDGAVYDVCVPGFGFVGCSVVAKSARTAKKVVADFVGNELAAEEELTDE